MSTDLLGDLLNSHPASTTPIIPSMPLNPSVVASTTSAVPQKPLNDPLDILNDLTPSHSHVIYEKHGLRIELSPTKDSSILTLVEAKFSSIEGANINDIVLQVAVPKVRVNILTNSL